ncbi:hypothetical protein E6C29_26755 [Klebsiella pneumoniae]|uniref:hypothetical protein n=1 Tax=Klebsiella TaxID=570 RepID=UPI000D72B394|nr:hypothetical protein [Klebsiella pneumoniae]EKW9153288.1 hypothetical protein [Klebsiella pneumoniae]MBF7849675.1 hypothetical protein [Klebsiella pneumoniae]MBV1997805.1 hypothetical protein [Klebsiella pneumoniae]MBW4951209.1 hypothetical protein [Klebsiella pneumoniae]MCD9435799.1 hypothetical protein [Klebsiella pneumoniae]
MSERGMIFNAEMVRALLDGRKTQTRRPIKWKQTRFTEIGEREDGSKWPWSEDAEHACDFWHPCPFGAVGDRIWVRETWGVVSHAFSDDGLMIDWVPDRPATAIHEMPFGNGYYSGYAIYAADGDFTWGDDDGYEDGRSCWKPSIHMPKAASRILLEITDVRVERLNAISQEDAEAEGIDMEALYDSQDCYDCIADHNMTGRPTVTGAFKYLWESIYGEEGWKSNPWVWVIEFKRFEGGAA